MPTTLKGKRLSLALVRASYAPSENRLKMSSHFGATTVINNGDGKAVERIVEIAGGRGLDTAIEEVGRRASSPTSLPFRDIIALAEWYHDRGRAGAASCGKTNPTHKNL
jgi:threonine dehydrogenase-like Zn-dependent dehydrogenase